MRKLKWLVIVIAITLMLSGVAYAGWAEKIELNFNTKTAYTEFSILDVQEDELDVDASMQGQVTIRAEELEQGEEASADIIFVNKSSIPINLDRIAISNVGGYESNNKHNIYIDIRAYANGNLIFNESENVNYWNSNGSVHRKNSLKEIPVGSTVTIKVTVRFESKAGDNGKKNGKGQGKKDVFDNVTFILRPEYSRFNQDSI